MPVSAPRFHAVLAVFLACLLDATAQVNGAAERGRRLYRTGMRADGSPVTTATNQSGTALPPAFVACINCHGYDARGKTEGGAIVSDIRWETLSKPYDILRDDGRHRAPYDAARFFRALTEGTDSSDRLLDPTMPRYHLSAAEAADLSAYLQQPASSTDEGVTTDTIRIGLVLSDTSAMSASAQSDRRLLAARFDELNRQGGIFRRRLELIEIDPAHPAEVLVVLVGSAPMEPRDSAWETAGIPTLRVTAGQSTATSHYSFAIFPSQAEQARALVRYAATHSESATPSVALIYQESSISPAMVDSIVSSIAPLCSVKPVQVLKSSLDQPLISLREAGATHALLICSASVRDEIIQRSPHAGWDPLFLSPDPPSVGAVGRRVVSLVAVRPSDVSPEALLEYRRVADHSGKEKPDQLHQLELLATTRVLITALENAGREIDREKLTAMLEALRDFRSGFGPPIGFAPRHHVAVRGTYVAYPSASPGQSLFEWVPLDPP